jgi:hypothetical protein
MEKKRSGRGPTSRRMQQAEENRERRRRRQSSALGECSNDQMKLRLSAATSALLQHGRCIRHHRTHSRSPPLPPRPEWVVTFAATIDATGSSSLSLLSLSWPSCHTSPRHPASYSPLLPPRRRRVVSAMKLKTARHHRSSERRWHRPKILTQMARRLQSLLRSLLIGVVMVSTFFHWFPLESKDLSRLTMRRKYDQLQKVIRIGLWVLPCQKLTKINISLTKILGGDSSAALVVARMPSWLRGKLGHIDRNRRSEPESFIREKVEFTVPVATDCCS